VKKSHSNPATGIGRSTGQQKIAVQWREKPIESENALMARRLNHRRVGFRKGRVVGHRDIEHGMIRALASDNGLPIGELTPIRRAKHRRTAEEIGEPARMSGRQGVC
jgi:hypothetical protein